MLLFLFFYDIIKILYIIKERKTMDSSDIWKIVLVVAMMIFSAIFSSTETAFSSVNKLRLKNYEAQGSKKAKKALKLANRFDEVLTISPHRLLALSYL